MRKTERRIRARPFFAAHCHGQIWQQDRHSRGVAVVREWQCARIPSNPSQHGPPRFGTLLLFCVAREGEVTFLYNRPGALLA